MPRFKNLKMYPETYVVLKKITVIEERSIVKTLDRIIKKEYRRLKRNDQTREERV